MLRNDKLNFRNLLIYTRQTLTHRNKPSILKRSKISAWSYFQMIPNKIESKVYKKLKVNLPKHKALSQKPAQHKMIILNAQWRHKQSEVNMSKPKKPTNTKTSTKWFSQPNGNEIWNTHKSCQLFTTKIQK